MKFEVIVTFIVLVFALIIFSMFYSAILPVYLNQEIQLFFLLLLFLSGVFYLMYFVFIRKNPLTENTAPWKFEAKNLELIDKLKKTLKDVFNIIFLAALFTSFFYNFLAIPTRWFADQPVRMVLDCVEINQAAKVLARYRDIVTVDKTTGAEWELIWPANNVPSCPGRIVVEGKSWYTGTYVEQVWNVYP